MKWSYIFRIRLKLDLYEMKRRPIFVEAVLLFLKITKFIKFIQKVRKKLSNCVSSFCPPARNIFRCSNDQWVNVHRYL